MLGYSVKSCCYNYGRYSIYIDKIGEALHVGLSSDRKTKLLGMQLTNEIF